MGSDSSNPRKAPGSAHHSKKPSLGSGVGNT